MSNARSKKDRPLTESMKIRYYVMDLLYSHPRVEVKLPSIRELAKKFGVANSTVAEVLNKLKLEKFLVARPGVGIFNNPEFIESWPAKAPLIGVIYSYGKHFFYEKKNWNIIAEIGKALCGADNSIRFLTLQGTSEETVCDELRNSYLDALVWIESDEATETLLLRLEESGIPVLTVNFRFPGVNSVEFSRSDLVRGAQTVAETLKRLLATPDRVEHIKI